jgi:hypothetical protein
MMGVTAQGESLLPAGAIPCDYLYTNATAGGSDGLIINTSLVPLATMSYEADLLWVTPGNETNAAFGYYLGGERYTPMQTASLHPEVGYNSYYTDSSVTLPYVLRVKQKAIATQTYTHNCYYQPDGTLYQDVLISYDETSFTPSSSKTLGIMGRKTNDGGSSYDRAFQGGVGRLKCYSDDHYGPLIADFVPCYYQGSFGMWERVSQTFLTGYDSTKVFGIGEAWNTQGFTPNSINNSNYQNSDLIGVWKGMITSPKIAIPAGCTTIQVRTAPSGTSNRPYIMCFNANGGYASQKQFGVADYQFTVGNNDKFIRMSMLAAQKDNCYIYDATHGEYIWKGINVT